MPCDRTVFLTKASRHRICKGCRSAKKKKNIASGTATNSKIVSKSASTKPTSNNPLSLAVPSEMFDNGDTDSLLALDTTRSFGAPGTIGTLGTIGEGFTPGGGGHAYTAGSGLASFQPLLTGGESPPTVSKSPRRRESFPLSTHDTVSVDYMNIPGMAPVNYASVGAKAEENKKRRQPPRPSAMSKGDDYYYNEPGSSQSKRYKAEFSESRAMTTNLTTRNGDSVQLLPCVCTKGGFCHRPQHAIGKPCDNICRISKNVRHRVCKGCRSGGKRDPKGSKTNSIGRRQALVLSDTKDGAAAGGQSDDEEEDIDGATLTLSALSGAHYIKEEALKADEAVEKETFAMVDKAPLYKQGGEVLMRRQPECGDEDYTEADEKDLLNGVENGPLIPGRLSRSASSENCQSTLSSSSKASKEDAVLLSSMLSKFQS